MVKAWYKQQGVVKNIDATINGDGDIQAWVSEMRASNGARMKYFPDIRNLKELTEVLTMCIHIASPQHTAVNYLQEYYQIFVPNKPSSYPKWERYTDSRDPLGTAGEKNPMTTLYAKEKGEPFPPFSDFWATQ